MEATVLELVNLYIKIGGLPLVFLIIFIETGIFLGFFLPGDSLLFALGIIAAAKIIDLNLTLVGCTVAAILGNYFAYFAGYFLADKVLANLLNKYSDHIKKTQEFYSKYGSFAIIYARFIPFFRGFVPFLAGMVKMNFITYSIYNVVSAFIWVFSLTLLGYFLGISIPNIEKYVHVIILVIILVSLLPIFYKTLKAKVEKT
ncbi:MAG: VTT domain-containing protein [Candidatus Calescibacterium sp.]|nr:VTT domain-containing protein [Candidatus Calescibacterium sp.]MDW8133269.1 VTT domain-containing protein [Candidatus Calescibacterium sp.]